MEKDVLNTYEDEKDFSQYNTAECNSNMLVQTTFKCFEGEKQFVIKHRRGRSISKRGPEYQIDDSKFQRHGVDKDADKDETEKRGEDNIREFSWRSYMQ